MLQLHSVQQHKAALPAWKVQDPHYPWPVPAAGQWLTAPGPSSLQSTNMAFGKVTEETVYTCTGHPLKTDIANILDWMLNQDFTTAYKSILSGDCHQVQAAGWPGSPGCSRHLNLPGQGCQLVGSRCPQELSPLLFLNGSRPCGTVCSFSVHS